MSNDNFHFDLLLQQQSYYFVILSNLNGYRLTDYWEQIKSSAQTKLPSVFKQSNYEIQHKRMQSDIPYARGQILKTLSISDEGAGPYLYDLFALKVSLASEECLILAFPFASLARDLLESINISRRKCDYLKINPAKLINQNQSINDSDNVLTKIVGLTVSIPKKNNTVTSLSLAGNSPLDSDIYKTFIKQPIINGEAIPKRCVLAFEIFHPLIEDEKKDFNDIRLRSRIHVDAFGNFKFYVHLGGINFFILPSFLKYLSSLNGLEITSVNPLLRLREDEE